MERGGRGRCSVGRYRVGSPVVTWWMNICFSAGHPLVYSHLLNIFFLVLLSNLHVSTTWFEFNFTHLQMEVGSRTMMAAATH